MTVDLTETLVLPLRPKSDSSLKCNHKSTLTLIRVLPEGKAARSPQLRSGGRNKSYTPTLPHRNPGRNPKPDVIPNPNVTLTPTPTPTPRRCCRTSVHVTRLSLPHRNPGRNPKPDLISNPNPNPNPNRNPTQVLPDERPRDTAPVGSRYDDLISIFGAAFHTRLANARTFVVGCGALGCEYLKVREGSRLRG